MVLIDANARAQSMQQVMTNLSFAIDSMTREIRTGRGFYCDSADISGDLADDQVRDCQAGTYLSIVEGGISLTGGNDNSRISYRYNEGWQRIERRIGTGDWYAITSPEINVTDMYFYVTDTETGRNGDDKQASATIFIEGYAGELLTAESSFSLQTTITKRVLDI